jgi:sarcosine oxidase, subunit beta
VPAQIEYLNRPPPTAEVVVIGGGVVGAATAFYLSRAGLRPVVVERRAALCTLTTPASTGAFRLQFDNREELELVRESVELFLNFAEVTEQETYDLRLRQQGYLWVTTDERRAEWQRELVATQHSWGQTDIEILDAGEVTKRFPHVTQAALQARFRAGDGFVDSKALTFGLAAGSRASVALECGATGFDIAGEKLAGVKTVKGTIATETAVIAAGPFSGIVAATAGVELPIVTVTRRKLIMPEVPQVPPGAPMTIDDDTGAHWRPALSGAYLLFTDPETPPTPPAEQIAPDHHFALRLLDPASPVSVARIAPFWTEVWERGDANWLMQSGQYTITPDHRPLLGTTPVEGLYVNSGYSGHGIMGSPAGSRHLTDVLTGKIGEEDNRFRLDRAFEHRERDLL